MGSVWYCDQPYGNHKIGKTIKELCKNAGLVGKFTNHSLCAMSATCMYDHGIPEQIIKGITGHKSECVYNYKRTSDKLREKASKTISGASDGENCEQSLGKVTQKKVEVQTQSESLKQQLDELLSACNIIKNVIKTRLEMRKKQGEKCHGIKRKMAQSLVKKTKKRCKKQVGVVGGKGHVVIDLNLNVNMKK